MKVLKGPELEIYNMLTAHCTQLQNEAIKLQQSLEAASARLQFYIDLTNPDVEHLDFDMETATFIESAPEPEKDSEPETPAKESEPKPPKLLEHIKDAISG